MGDFMEKLGAYTKEVEEAVLAFLPEEESRLHDAMKYSVCGGGKRLRPLIMRQVFRSLGGKADAERIMLEPFMAAIEYIHSYSLVHDDLPEMDNDGLRRGKPTTHVEYGQAMAVLAGDGLLNLAFETAAEAVLAASYSGNKTYMTAAANALSVLGQKSGSQGMAGGQAVDVELSGKKIDRLTLDYIYRNKTAALIEAAFVIGAMLADADDETVSLLEEAAGKLGMAFQIRDDILDETAETEELGKPVHSDAENNKTTFVTLYGLEKAQKEVENLSRDAKKIIGGLMGENCFLVQLIEYLMNRNA